jgi:hypothetical protein
MLCDLCHAQRPQPHDFDWPVRRFESWCVFIVPQVHCTFTMRRPFYLSGFVNGLSIVVHEPNTVPIGIS